MAPQKDRNGHIFFNNVFLLEYRNNLTLSKLCSSVDTEYFTSAVHWVVYMIKAC